MTEIERINAILRRSDIKTWVDVITEENKTLRFEKSFDHKEFEIAFSNLYAFKKKFAICMRLANEPSNCQPDDEKLVFMGAREEDGMYGLQILAKYFHWEDFADDEYDENLLLVWVKPEDTDTLLELIAKYFWGAEWNEAEFMYIPFDDISEGGIGHD